MQIIIVIHGSLVHHFISSKSILHNKSAILLNVIPHISQVNISNENLSFLLTKRGT